MAINIFKVELGSANFKELEKTLAEFPNAVFVMPSKTKIYHIDGRSIHAGKPHPEAVRIITHDSKMIDSYEISDDDIIITKSGQRHYYKHSISPRLITADEWFESLSDEDKEEAIQRQEEWR